MLSINISEVIWTVIDFFVLFYVLRKLLYTPLRQFMAQRQNKIDAGIALRREAQHRADEAEQNNAELLEKAKLRAGEILKRENEQEQADHLRTVEGAQQYLLDAHLSAEAEAAQYMDEEESVLLSCSDALARKLAQKLLS